MTDAPSHRREATGESTNGTTELATTGKATPRRAAAPKASSSARPIEIELKYAPASAAAAERLLAADEIAGLSASSRTRTIPFEDRYLDTADGAIARAGYAVRARTTPSGTIVSIKSARRSGEGATHRREELEGPADQGDRPGAWPASDARSLVLELCGDAALTELVTVRQVRRRRLLRADRTTIELSLDEVEAVSRGEVIDRWLELEMELRRGDEGRLRDVASILERDPEMVPLTGSKLERALRAVRARETASAPRPVPPAGPDAQARAVVPPVPRSPGVLADDHLAEAGRKVLRFHFARMVSREAGTRDGTDPRNLHAMRVATRRMRAAWRIFGSGFREDRTKKLRNRLRELARSLGAVRDLDVLLQAVELDRADLSTTDQGALEPLLAAWQADRADARERLMRLLDTDAHARFVEELGVFLHTEGAAVRDFSPTEPHHVRDTAPSRIWAAYEQVRAYEPVLRWADIETLHELRIAAKWLRYSIEFVREPLGDEADALIPRVVALQDHLGLMHDADVSAAMARRFLVERAGLVSGVESAAIGRYLVSREREVARLRRSVGGPWRGVAGLTFRRRLGRAVATL